MVEGALIGYALGVLLIVLFVVLSEGVVELSMWYRTKYGKFTLGDGRNYLQIFKRSIWLR